MREEKEEGREGEGKRRETVKKGRRGREEE